MEVFYLPRYSLELNPEEWLNADFKHAIRSKIPVRTKAKAMSPQTNGICERVHKTILQKFYQVTFRKKLYANMESLQKDLDEWLNYYNNEKTHQGKVCNGRTPLETLLCGKPVWSGKNLNQI